MNRRLRVPFPLLDEMPDSLRGVILDFHWDLARLHSLRLPEQALPVPDLDWHLQLPFWAVDGRPFEVSPAEVAAEPDRFSDQWRRTMASDLRFPLDGYLRSDGRVTVLDGVHRLLKASVLGDPVVQIRLLQEADVDTIVVRAR